MRNGEYGLGIDVGDGAVSAAVCGPDDEAVPLPLGEGPVTVAVGDGGRIALVPADGTARRAHLVARVGDPVPVHAGGRAVPAAELVADAVQRVRALAAEREGRPDAWTVVTVPPSWAGHRCAVLAAALTDAGVPRFSLVSAAVAAVAAHVAAGDLPPEPTVAVHDLGEGSLDTAVVGPGPERLLEHLAVPPAPLRWGGRDVDDLVLAHVVDCLGTPGGDAAALRRACRTAKEALSTATVVRVDADGVDGPVRLTREELDEELAGPVRESAAALAVTVAAAGLDPEDLDAVVLVGGGVRVPLVAEAVSDELGRPLVVGGDPALTAALGAAALAADALAAEPPAERTPPPGPRDEPPALEEAPPASPLPRGARGRSRPGAPPRAATRPGPRRGGRLGRGAVVAGLALGLLLLGPAAAGLFDAVLVPGPVGQEADGGGVVAQGSAAVGDGSAAARAGAAAAGDEPRRTADRTGSPARTSLAAAIATAAGSDAPSVSGTAAPTTDRPGSRTTALPSNPPRAPGGAAAPGTATSGAPAPGASASPPPSGPAPAVGQAPGSGRPSASPPPSPQPPSQTPAPHTPAPQTPVEPEPEPEPKPSPPEPSPPEPSPPATEEPVAEEPAAEETPADPAPAPAGDPAAEPAPATGGAA